MSWESEFIDYLKFETNIDFVKYRENFTKFKKKQKEESWDYLPETDVFKITDKHLKLIRRMQVGWQFSETGAPQINPKRPYGNSDVARDVGEILEYKPRGYDGDPEEYSEKQCEKFLRLHRETEIALQIVLQTGKFEKGTYYRENSWDEWEKL